MIENMGKCYDNAEGGSEGGRTAGSGPASEKAGPGWRRSGPSSLFHLQHVADESPRTWWPEFLSSPVLHSLAGAACPELSPLPAAMPPGPLPQVALAAMPEGYLLFPLQP